MTHQTYQIYTSETATFTASLDTTQPLRLLTAELVARAGLPDCDQQGQPVAYALFAGSERRRLSSEQSLEQATCPGGSALYLTPANAPWWARTFVGRRPPAPPATAQTPDQRIPDDTRRPPVTTASLTSLPARMEFPLSPVVLLIVGLGVVAIIALWFFFSADNSASGSTLASALVVEPSITSNVLPTATLVAESLQPTSTTLPVPISVTAIEPPTINLAAESPPITLTGSNFSAVEQVTLIPEHTAHAPVPMAFEVQDATRLVISPAAPVGDLSDAIVYTIVINNRPVGSITHQPAIRSVQAQGILVDYRNRNPGLFFKGQSGSGAFLWAEAEFQTRVPASVGSVVISNGDTLDILDESIDGVYQVRVRTNALDSADPKVIGTTGWIARWLVDNQGVPPAPTQAPVPAQPPAQARPGPMVFNGSLFEQPTDGNVTCGTVFASAVWGTVYGKSGVIAGAVVQVTSADGGNSFTGVTNGQGNFSIGGLGCTTWIVQVVSVPDGNIQSQAVSVSLNGGRYSGAGIDFYQQ